MQIMTVFYPFLFAGITVIRLVIYFWPNLRIYYFRIDIQVRLGFTARISPYYLAYHMLHILWTICSICYEHSLKTSRIHARKWLNIQHNIPYSAENCRLCYMLNRMNWEFSWSIKLFNQNQGMNPNGYKIRSFLRILFIFTNNSNLLRNQNFLVRNDTVSNLDVWQTELHALPIQSCNRSTS